MKFLLCIVLFIALTNATTTNIVASKDVTADLTGPSCTNYGGLNYIQVARFSIFGTPHIEDDYIEFSLTGLSGTIISATINLYQNNTSCPGFITDPSKFKVATCNDFNEFTLIGHTALSCPISGIPSDISYITDVTVAKSATTVSIDVTSTVQSYINNGNTFIAFHFYVPSTWSSYCVDFNSREQLNNQPTLVVVS